MQKSKLTEEEVQHVAKLAKLELKPQEIEKYQKQLSELLGYVEILEKVNTKDVEPTTQVTGLENIFRNDHSKPSLTVEEALSGTQKIQSNLFKVKAIFEE